MGITDSPGGDGCGGCGIFVGICVAAIVLVVLAAVAIIKVVFFM